MSYLLTTQRSVFMPKSNHMKCDICGDPMDVYFKSKWEIDRYSCYPCKHTVYASDAWRYDSPVRIKGIKNDSKQCS